MAINFISCLLLVTGILVTANSAVVPRDLEEDVARAKSAMSNFTADSFILEQRLAKFLPVVDGQITDIVLQIQTLLVDLGVSEENLNTVSNTVDSANSTVHVSIDKMVSSLRDLEGHCMVINNDLLNNLLGNIEADLSIMNQMTERVQREYTSGFALIQTAVSLVHLAIQDALVEQGPGWNPIPAPVEQPPLPVINSKNYMSEHKNTERNINLVSFHNMSGPEVETIQALIDEATAILYEEKLNIDLAKSFYDESRIVAEDALAAVVQGLP